MPVKILIVDDEPDALRMMELKVRQYFPDCPILTASGGAAGFICKPFRDEEPVSHSPHDTDSTWNGSRPSAWATRVACAPPQWHIGDLGSDPRPCVQPCLGGIHIKLLTAFVRMHQRTPLGIQGNLQPIAPIADVPQHGPLAYKLIEQIRLFPCQRARKSILLGAIMFHSSMLKVQ